MRKKKIRPRLAEDVICTAQQAEVRKVGREGKKRTGTGAAARHKHEEGCSIRAYTDRGCVSDNGRPPQGVCQRGTITEQRS